MLEEGKVRKGLTNPDPEGKRPNPPKPQKAVNARMPEDTLKAIEIIRDIIEAIKGSIGFSAYVLIDKKQGELDKIINDNKEK